MYWRHLIVLVLMSSFNGLNDTSGKWKQQDKIKCGQTTIEKRLYIRIPVEMLHFKTMGFWPIKITN